jgi:hypothetical protein
MTATAPVTSFRPTDCITTLRKVWQTVQTTKRVNDVYQNTQVLLREHIFKQQFLNAVTKEVHDVCKEAETNFINSEPFPIETYREARETYDLLSECLETLTILSNVEINWVKLPRDFHPLVRAVRQLFLTLTKCHAHLSARFAEMDKMHANINPSKYLSRETSAERWASRPTVYTYQV